MDFNAVGALSLYTFQNTLSQTGNASQALLQALSLGRAQGADISALVGSAGSVNPIDALAGAPAASSLADLAYGVSAAGGTGGTSVQTLLASLGGGSTSIAGLFANPDQLPVSTNTVTPNATQALAQFAYGQNQSPAEAASNGILAVQQAIQDATLNLLV